MTTSYPPLSSTPSNGIKRLRKATDIPSLPIPPAYLQNPPQLPSTPRPLEFVPGYTVTTHIIPAAFPRYSYQEPLRYASTAATILNDPPPSSASKAEKQKWIGTKIDEIREKTNNVENLRIDGAPQDGPLDDNGPVLWTVVNRYARVASAQSNDARKGLTIVSCHGIGIHKEVRPAFLRIFGDTELTKIILSQTYEPTLKHLIRLSSQPSSDFVIDELWSIDMADAGDSALLNKGKLGDQCELTERTVSSVLGQL